MCSTFSRDFRAAVVAIDCGVVENKNIRTIKSTKKLNCVCKTKDPISFLCVSHNACYCEILLSISLVVGESIRNQHSLSIAFDLFYSHARTARLYLCMKSDFMHGVYNFMQWLVTCEIKCLI